MLSFTCFLRLGVVICFFGFQSAVFVVLRTIVSQCAIGCLKLNLAFVVLACSVSSKLDDCHCDRRVYRRREAVPPGKV